MPASALTAAALRPAGEQAKIDWLLSEIRNSGAVFIRNGTEHGGPQAVAHLERKLRSAGKRVQTARDFIMGIASRSQTSGRHYEIRWRDGRRRELAGWLLERLSAYEERGESAGQGQAVK